MTAPATAPAWRGLAAEEADEATAEGAALLHGPGRRLLAGMLRSRRGRVALTMALIVVASLAALAGPWLVGVGIDRGIPPLARRRDPGPLLALTAAFAVTVAVQAVATRGYIYAMGRLGEAVVLDLRRRLFAHFGELSVSFHEDYTSGRVIARQTSDIDAISGCSPTASTRWCPRCCRWSWWARACCCSTGRSAWSCWRGSRRWPG